MVGGRSRVRSHDRARRAQLGGRVRVPVPDPHAHVGVQHMVDGGRCVDRLAGPEGAHVRAPQRPVRTDLRRCAGHAVGDLAMGRPRLRRRHVRRTSTGANPHPDSDADPYAYAGLDILRGRVRALLLLGHEAGPLRREHDMDDSARVQEWRELLKPGLRRSPAARHEALRDSGRADLDPPRRLLLRIRRPTQGSFPPE